MEHIAQSLLCLFFLKEKRCNIGLWHRSTYFSRLLCAQVSVLAIHYPPARVGLLNQLASPISVRYTRRISFLAVTREKFGGEILGDKI